MAAVRSQKITTENASSTHLVDLLTFFLFYATASVFQSHNGGQLT